MLAALRGVPALDREPSLCLKMDTKNIKELDIDSQASQQLHTAVSRSVVNMHRTQCVVPLAQAGDVLAMPVPGGTFAHKTQQNQRIHH